MREHALRPSLRQPRRTQCRGGATAALTAFALVVAVVAPVPLGAAAQAQSTEERFQDLFLTAGYCTAFGAAIGTAVLAWTDDPTANLRFVAMGASLGFLGGSLLGSYVIFSPMLTENGRGVNSSTLLTDQPLPGHGVVVRPVYDTQSRAITSLEGGMTLLRF